MIRLFTMVVHRRLLRTPKGVNPPHCRTHTEPRPLLNTSISYINLGATTTNDALTPPMVTCVPRKSTQSVPLLSIWTEISGQNTEVRCSGFRRVYNRELTANLFSPPWGLLERYAKETKP